MRVKRKSNDDDDECSRVATSIVGLTTEKGL